jgi:opacity protein-like surface antigen
LTTVTTAVQIYATYRTDGLHGIAAENFGLSAELGYIDVGDTQRDGFWLTPMVAWHATDLIDILFRAGIEYGDDIGAVYGAGLSYQLERNMAVRLEYVEHPNASSMMMNVVYYPWSLPF